MGNTRKTIQSSLSSSNYVLLGNENQTFSSYLRITFARGLPTISGFAQLLTFICTCMPYPTKSWLLSFGALIICNFLFSQSFEKVTFEAGILHQYQGAFYGGGVSFYDFNKDGWDDISLVDINLECKFYQNNGDGTFTLLPPFFNAVSGFTLKQLNWVDFDNDGDADISITAYGSRLRLYRNNGNFVFTEVATLAGIPNTFDETFGHSWGDYNRDGFLDLYICNYDYFVPDATNYLYRNNGNGTFTDVSVATGTSDGYNMSLGAVFCDYNNDFWSDLFVMNDRLECYNHMYRNNGGTFSDETEGLNLDYNILSMSNSWGDYDNDGDFDLYIANGNGNLLHRNENGNSFTEVANAAGATIDDFSWSSAWLDYDLDTDLDLHVCVKPLGPSDGQNRFLLNNGNGTFTDYSTQVGISPDPRHSHSSAWGDFNNDGYPDIAINNDFPSVSDLWQNTGGNGNHYLKVSLQGTVSNRDGIGSRIELYNNGGIQTRFTICGEYYLSQNSQRQIFGLGQSTQVDSLIIKWPSGYIDRFYNLEADQALHIREGSSIEIDLGESPQSLCNGPVTLYAGDFDSYLWSNGAVTPSITVYNPGNYSVVVFTQEGISATSDTINVLQPGWSSPITTIVQPSCPGSNDGSIFLQFGNPFPQFPSSISWNNGSTGFLNSNLSPGNYTCIYTYGGGCQSELTFILDEPVPPSPVTTTSDITCFGAANGSIMVNNDAGTGTGSVNWSNGMNGSFISNLPAGTYSYTLVDSLGCVAQGSTEINEPQQLTVSISTTPAIDAIGGSATVEAGGGIPPYVLSWSNGEQGWSQGDLPAGAYSVLLTDANGCTLSANFLIEQQFTIGLNAIGTEYAVPYPNPGDGRIFLDAGLCKTPSEYRVFSLRGELLFAGRISGDDACTLNLETLPAGTFVVEITGTAAIRFVYVRM